MNLYHWLGDAGLAKKEPIEAVLKEVREITCLPLVGNETETRRRYFKRLGPKCPLAGDKLGEERMP